MEGDNPSTSEAGVFSLQATHFPQHGSGLPPQDPAFGHRNHEFVVINSFTAFNKDKFGVANFLPAPDRKEFGVTNSLPALNKYKFCATNSFPTLDRRKFAVTNSFSALKKYKFGATNTSAGLLARVSTIPKPIAAYAGRNKIAKGASL